MVLFKTLHRLKIIPFLKKWYILNLILGFLDILAISVAYQISYSFYYSDWNNWFIKNNTLFKLYLIITPVWLIILYFINITHIPRTKRYRILFLQYFQSAILIIFVSIIIYFSFRLYMVPRQFLVEITLLGFLFLFTLRFLEYKFFKNYRAKGYNYINLVLICDSTALSFIRNLIQKPEWGYKFVTIYTDSEEIINEFTDSMVFFPALEVNSIGKLMEVYLVDEVVYYKSKILTPEVRSIIRSCEELGVTFNLHVDKSDHNLSNAIRTSLAEEHFLTYANIPYKPTSLLAKRLMDISLSLLLLLFFLPLMVFIVVSIWLSTKGPAIFKQERVGLRGRTFSMYKFRTMIHNAEKMQKDLEDLNEVDGPVFKIEDDPRTTKTGRHLRRTGLDELPQLFNVLKGEMSLIGPRPALKSETLKYKRWQLRRLSVKPGLSCFWQIKPERNNIKFEKWMEMDLAYIDNWSFRLDLIILFKTIKTFLSRTGL